MRLGLAFILAALSACGLLPGPVQGGCTLTLTQDGTVLSAPYRALMLDPVNGENRIRLIGHGWDTSVAVTQIDPHGEIAEMRFEADLLAGGFAVLLLSEPGIFHFVFRDRSGCRLEFDIESRAP